MRDGRRAARLLERRVPGRASSAAPTARARPPPCSRRCFASCGPRVGLFTSPHLVRYNERVQIDGVPVSDARAGARVRAHRGGARRRHADLLRIQHARGAGSCSARRAVEAMVLEVGLGGGSMRPTSSMPTWRCCARSASIIATGSATRSSRSARRRPGIFRRGQQVVLGSADMPAERVAAAARARLRRLDRRARFQLAHRGRRTRRRSSGTTAPQRCTLRGAAAAGAARGDSIPQRRHGAHGAAAARGDGGLRARSGGTGAARAAARRVAFRSCPATSSGFWMWLITSRRRAVLAAALAARPMRGPDHRRRGHAGGQGCGGDRAGTRCADRSLAARRHRAMSRAA